MIKNAKLTIKSQQTVALLLNDGADEINGSINASVMRMNKNTYAVVEKPAHEVKHRKCYLPLVKNRLANLTKRADGHLWFSAQTRISIGEITDMSEFELKMHGMLQEILDRIAMCKLLEG